MTRFLLALALVLCAVPAGAADWLKYCRTGQVVTGLSPGEWACNVPTSSTDDSGTISVGGCENIDLLYFDDTDGDGTAGGGTIQGRSCSDSTADAEGCWVIENLTLDGNSATNTEAIYGVAGNFIYADVTAYATTTEPIKAIVKCNGAHR